MRWEMNEKVQHLSKVLVEELQTRDQLIHSLNVKNTFISSLLKVQSIRYHPSEEKSSTAKVSSDWLKIEISLNRWCYCPSPPHSTCTLWYHSIHRTEATGALACYNSSPKVYYIHCMYLHVKILHFFVNLQYWMPLLRIMILFPILFHPTSNLKVNDILLLFSIAI